MRGFSLVDLLLTAAVVISAVVIVTNVSGCKTPPGQIEGSQELPEAPLKVPRVIVTHVATIGGTYIHRIEDLKTGVVCYRQADAISCCLRDWRKP